MSAERHVIKGRGPNRGKYLCHPREAEGMDPPPPTVGRRGDTYVWLPEQRKAARYGDPRYGEEHAKRIAAELRGYFVKLVAPVAVVAAVPELKTFIAEHAEGAEGTLDAYWFDGDFHDAGESFCRRDAEKLVDERFVADPKDEYFEGCETAEDRYNATIDGGWSLEYDSPPRCETCEAKLDGSLTDYGADQEIDALTGPGYADGVLGVEDWDALDRAVGNLLDDDPRWRKIARVVEAARGAAL